MAILLRLFLLKNRLFLYLANRLRFLVGINPSGKLEVCLGIRELWRNSENLPFQQNQASRKYHGRMLFCQPLALLPKQLHRLALGFLQMKKPNSQFLVRSWLKLLALREFRNFFPLVLLQYLKLWLQLLKQIAAFFLQWHFYPVVDQLLPK